MGETWLLGRFVAAGAAAIVAIIYGIQMARTSRGR